MKIKHKVRVPVAPSGGDYVDDDYQREVDRSTNALEAAYRRAERRLEKALAKAESVDPSGKSKKKSAVELWALVELRRSELNGLLRQMQSSPQSSTHRGTSGWRSVPITMGNL